ncbi:MAG: GTPase HflX, partial [Clostridiales bacterium]|nr:GTPase HflX [Clostridiales bacterium]
MIIEGNVGGVPKQALQTMEGWAERVTERACVIDGELAAEMAVMTARLNREIAIYLDRRGKVAHIALGSGSNVQLAEISRRRASGRPCGLRCIHTHPGGSGVLSEVDLSALSLLDLDCMAALGVDANGLITDVGLAFAGEETRRLYADMNALAEVDFLGTMAVIEKNRPARSAQEQGEDAEERVVLAALSQGRPEDEVNDSLAELANLAQTAGLKVLSAVVQHKEKPSPATYVGKGKVEELRHSVQVNQAGVVLFDDEISPAQMRNLEQAVGCKIIDRTMLILDIFARRARSNEGKIQVELAQLRYLLPRLTGQGLQLSRLGGGIGTRGPGETKLETDRRRLRGRISELEKKLEAVLRARQQQRQSRVAERLPLVALVGYTNAGKSSLLNALSGEDAFVADLLFATLDPLTRKVEPPAGRAFLLSDTVGFIRKLPHHLVAAFRATLEEVREADLLLHVLDASAADVMKQAEAVNEVLSALGAAEKPVIMVINKTDLLENEADLHSLLSCWKMSAAVSAKNRQGLDELLAMIERSLPSALTEVEIMLPFSRGALLSALHEKALILEKEYRGEGTYLRLMADEKMLKLLKR